MADDKPQKELTVEEKVSKTMKELNEFLVNLETKEHKFTVDQDVLALIERISSGFGFLLIHYGMMKKEHQEKVKAVLMEVYKEALTDSFTHQYAHDHGLEHSHGVDVE